MRDASGSVELFEIALERDLVPEHSSFEMLLREALRLIDQQDKEELGKFAGSLRGLPELENADLLSALILAALGEREFLLDFCCRSTDKADLSGKLSGVFWCESFDLSALSELLVEDLSKGVAPQRFAETVEETIPRGFRLLMEGGDADPASPSSSKNHAWNSRSTAAARRAIIEAEGIEEIRAAELLRLLQHLDQYSRYDHLADKVRVPIYHNSLERFVGRFAPLNDEVTLRLVLDWVAAGEWDTAVAAADALAVDAGANLWARDAAQTIARYCRLQFPAAGASKVTLSEAIDRAGCLSPLGLLTTAFEALSVGQTFELDAPFAVGREDETIPQSEIERAVSMLERNAFDESHGALAEIGDIADGLLRGSSFERSLAVWLRASQVHSLIRRGHYKYALRVARYVSVLVQTHRLAESSCADRTRNYERLLEAVVEEGTS